MNLQSCLSIAGLTLEHNHPGLPGGNLGGSEGSYLPWGPSHLPAELRPLVDEKAYSAAPQYQQQDFPAAHRLGGLLQALQDG